MRARIFKALETVPTVPTVPADRPEAGLTGADDPALAALIGMADEMAATMVADVTDDAVRRIGRLMTARVLKADAGGLWHVLMCQPQSEMAVALAVVEIGADAFVPHVWTRRRVSRHSKRVRAVPRPWLPGFVFFRWPSVASATPPKWSLIRGITEAVTKRRLVRDWIAFGGQPSAVHPDDMRRLVEMACAARPHVVAAEARKRLQPGTTARIQDGAFAAHDMRIDTVDGGAAHGWVRLFGGDVRVSVPIEQFIRR